MLTNQQMLSTFVPQREPYRPLVGFEWEIQCFERESLSPLRFDGARGLGAVLKEAARLTGGTASAYAPGDPLSRVSLPGGSLLSLEPGGQLEYSSAPTETFGAALEQVREYLALLGELRQRFDLHYFFGGVNPVHTVEQIGLVTRTGRYQIMDAYYPRSGTMGRRMMRQTCSIQVSFDYRDRAQGHELLRTAQFVAPLAAALFANSPFADGRVTGYRSFRVPIWANTDPARSGLLPGFARPDYGFDDYLAHVLRAPMFFVRTPAGGYVQAGGTTFAEFNARGFAGQQATTEDFVLHNSTIFTDVRLKQTVEVRSVDAQDPALLPAVLAYLCGILFCQRSRLRILRLLEQIPEAELRALPDRLSCEGIRGTINGASVQEVLQETIELAARGLPTCFADGAEAAAHLQPIRDLARRGLTPADLVLQRFGDDPLAWLRAGRML